MINAGIPKSIWPEIFAAIIKVINKITTRTLSGINPYKTFMNQVEPDKKSQYKPKVSYFRVFNYKYYVYVPEERKTKGNKLEKRAELEIFVRYEDT